LFAFALTCCHLHQLPINLLQLTAFLRCKHMPAFTAYLHGTGASGKALRAYLDAGCLLAVAFSGTIQGPIAFFKVVAKPERVADVIEHHSTLAGLRAQAATNHLQVQCH
jgi:hypothetical protein